VSTSDVNDRTVLESKMHVLHRNLTRQMRVAWHRDGDPPNNQRVGLQLRLRSQSRLPRDEALETLRRPRGRLRMSSRSFERDREAYELELELDDSDSASVSDDDSDPDDEPGSEREEADALLDDLFVRFLAGSLLLSFSRCFSFAAKIRFAVPLLFLNSSGTSTDCFPSALDLAGFSSCAVREGRDTYGRTDLHSYVKWPVRRHF